MKNIFLLLLSLGIFLNCSSQNYLEPAATEQLTKAGQFTFHAQKANVMGGDINAIANAIPNYTPNRMTTLDSGYTIEIEDKKLTCTLPYFGRVYSNSSYDTNKQGLRFTSEDFSVQKSTSKKGNTIFRIRPNDVSHINLINIEIYKNGKAFVSIDASDRQPISFDGYIAANANAGQ